MSEKDVNELFPIFLKTNELEVLIVGGGNVALEKLQALLTNSPRSNVKVVAREFSSKFIEYAELHENVSLEERSVGKRDFVNKQLAISAINDVESSVELMKIARENGVLYNAADKPELCDFYLGSVVRKGNLKIGISTNGKSPTIAKRLKEVLDENIPSELDESVTKLNKLRNHLSGDFTSKVKKLNKATAILTEKAERPWYLFSLKKFLSYALGVLGIMIGGHIFFSLVSPDAIWSSASETIGSLDMMFVWFMVGGFIAQMIDGALGMAYGVSASTFLTALGISPAITSMSVHASEIFTSGVSGIMHLRFGNVNNRLFKSIVIPGVLGAAVGAYALSELEQYSNTIKPIVSTYTLLLGVLIVNKVVNKNRERRKVKRVGWLATLGGFLDSIGGGGWGPVVSSTLIARGKHPRMIVGSVNLAEFFVSLASSFTFFLTIGGQAWQPIVGLILGGVIAAPIAAYLSSKLNIKAMMLFVGIVVILLSIRNILVSCL